MLFGVVGQMGQRMIFFWWVGNPNGKKHFFWGGEKIKQCNVMYRKHMGLQCGRSVIGSAVGNGQLAADEAGKSILCKRSGYAALHKLLW